MSANWRRYEELRPDQLAALIRESPVAFWPLGLLEHHGWHLPVGFDGLKAERICRRDDSVWPGGRPPPEENRHPGVCFDPADPLFSQLGEDARTASAERGEEGVSRLVDHLADVITQHLKNPT